MTVQETREIQKLMAARAPRYTRLGMYTTLPRTGHDGADLKGSIKALVTVCLREEIHRKTSRIILDGSLSSGDIITAEINSVGQASYTVLPGDTDDDVLEGLLQAIQGSANDSLVTVTRLVEDEDPDQYLPHLLVKGKAEADYDIAVGGHSNLYAEQDASSCNIRILLLDNGLGQAPNRWVQVNGGEFTINSFRGFTERYVTAGYNRLAVQVLNPLAADGVSPGKVQAFVAPAI